jgi:hypothetical protein
MNEQDELPDCIMIRAIYLFRFPERCSLGTMSAYFMM